MGSSLLARGPLAGGLWRGVSMTVVAALCLACVLGPSVAIATLPADAAAKGGRGTLKVKVVGLPRGEKGQIVVKGPRGFQARLGRGATLRRVRAGRYRVRVSKAIMRRSRGGVRRGAVASPVKGRLSATVRRGEAGTLTAEYGTIINPGVVKAPTRGVKIIGSTESPRALVVKGKRRLAKGAILSAAPGARFPNGLLVKITSSRVKGGRTTLRLRPASIYEVAPAMTFDVPLKAAAAANGSGLISSCGGLYKRIKVGRVSGSWNTLKVLGRQVPVGARLNATFTAEVGVDITAALGACLVRTPSIGLQALAGPIPVYGAISGDMHATAAEASVKAGGSVKFDIGATTVGVPPTLLWKPSVSADSPRFAISAERVAGITAGIGVRGELGVGAANAANLHIALDNSLNFTARPGACSWDLELGSVSGGGKLLGWDISTPSTPPFHKNLWRNSCGASGGGSEGGGEAGGGEPPAEGGGPADGGDDGGSSPDSDPAPALGTVGSVVPLPNDASLNSTYPSPVGGFIETYYAPDQESYYVTRKTSDARPAQAISIPVAVSDVTFGPDGTAYLTTSAFDDRDEGGELLRLAPDGTEFGRLYAWTAVEDGYARNPGPINYVGGRLYVEAGIGNVYFSCHMRLYRFTLSGSLEKSDGSTSCGGQWDSSPGQLSAIDYENHQVFYYDLDTLEGTSGAAIPSPVTGAASGKAGVYAFVSSQRSYHGTGCPTKVTRTTMGGTTWQEDVAPILGIDETETSCWLEDVAVLSDGSVLTSGTFTTDTSGELNEFLIAFAPNGTPSLKTLGQNGVGRIELAADGAGSAVVVHQLAQDCQEPGGSTNRCTRMVVDRYSDGTLSTLGTVGSGQWGDSVRSNGKPLINDGVVLLSFEKADYYGGSGSPYGSVQQRRYLSAPGIIRQSWHDPSE